MTITRMIILKKGKWDENDEQDFFFEEREEEVKSRGKQTFSLSPQSSHFTPGSRGASKRKILLDEKCAVGIWGNVHVCG